MQIINDRMENFVIFNMGNECENSDSKFFNLGKLSFTELLQSPTYSKTEHRKKDNTAHKIRSSQVYWREATYTNTQTPPIKQLIQMNCQRMNFSDRQTDLRLNFFQ